MLEIAENGTRTILTWNDPALPTVEQATEMVLGENWRNVIKNPELVRKAIFDLEDFLLTLPQVFLPITHHFSGGVYAREMLGPAGTIITGKIHTKDHINILSKGSLTVFTEHGIDHVKAPCTMVCKAGTKRVGYVHEDCVWTSIHSVSSENLEEVEDEIFTNDIAYYQLEAKQ